MRRVPNRQIMAGKMQAPHRFIDSKYGHMIGPLIATKQKLTRRIKRETPRIIPTRPFFGLVTKPTILSHGKDCDAIVQTVPRIHIAPIGGDEYLRTKITPRIPCR